jgi:ABC-type multidrug transport system fused ATPase/permease subunit
MKPILNLISELNFKSKLQFFFLICLVIVLSFINTLSVLSIAPVVDVLLENDFDNYSKITQIIISLTAMDDISLSFAFLFFGSTLVLAGVAAVFVQYMVFKIKYDVVIFLMTESFSQFFNSKYLFFLESNTGELLNTFQKESDKIGSTLGNIAKLIANSLQVLIFITVPFYISFNLTIVFILSAILITAPLYFINKKIYPLGKLNTETANKVSDVLQESLSAAKLVLSYSRQKQTTEKYKNSFQDHANISIPFFTYQFAISLLFMPLGMCAALFSIYYGINLGVSLAETAMILFAFFRMMPIAAIMFQTRSEITGFMPAFQQLQKLIDLARDFKESKDGREFDDFKKGLYLKNINFSYPNRVKVLNDINIEIPKNKTIALVGKSGSGKTTIADIILGLHKPSSGSFSIDDSNIDNINIDSFREKIGYVAQEPYLFNASIRENMKWSVPLCSDRDIWDALKVANIDIFVKSLETGLDTNMGDRGNKISGGQRQRLALARVILRKPLLLVLDEATSSLDNESEKLIQKSIMEVSKTSTTVIIAHRLSTIKTADIVYVIDDGALIESGNYEELILDKESMFYKMVTSQTL